MLINENWYEILQQKDINTGCNIFQAPFCVILKLAFLYKMLSTEQRTLNG
jgi:hypothetical protein